MNKDKISIIVPIYNGEKYLNRCIESIINQTYQNLEIILINDGSKDSSINILKKYQTEDKRIILIDKNNTGVSDTRNLGIKKATGEYICFCDCDDFYNKKYIETMYNTIKKQDVDVVRCNYAVVNSVGKQIEIGNLDNICYKILNNNDIKNKFIPKCLNGNIPCFCYLIMIKKEKLNTMFPLDIAMMEDVVFYIKLLVNIDKMYVINDNLYTIMYNENGATNSIKNYKRNILNILKVNKYIKEILKKEKILNTQNKENINLNNLNAISDFIFRYYLYSSDDIINFCKDIRINYFTEIVKETSLDNICLQRRIILIFIYKKKYRLLRIYFSLRKIIFNFRHKYGGES